MWSVLPRNTLKLIFWSLRVNGGGWIEAVIRCKARTLIAASVTLPRVTCNLKADCILHPAVSKSLRMA